MVCDSNQHFLAASQCDPLMAVEGSGPQSANAADDGTDACAFTASEDPAQQGSSSRANGGVFDAFAPPPS